MKKILLMILLLTACSPKTTAFKSPLDVSSITVFTDCDSLIQDALSKVKLDTNSNDLQLKIIQLSQALSDCQKDGTACKIALKEKPTVFIDKSKTKIKKSNNTKTKNSNNETEIYKLKNSILSRDSAITDLTAKNLSLEGKIKDLAKNGSSTGEESPATNKSGNTSTTNKAAWYLWLITFLAGAVTAIGVRSAITKTI